MHRNLTSLVVLKEDFYTALKRHSRLLFPRDFMARNQHLLEIKTLKKSDMNFCVMKSSSDLNRVQLTKLHLPERIWSRRLKSWCFREMSETLAFWAPGSKYACFSCSWKSPKCTGLCHGCVPGSGPVFSG